MEVLEKEEKIKRFYRRLSGLRLLNLVKLVIPLLMIVILVTFYPKLEITKFKEVSFSNEKGEKLVYISTTTQADIKKKILKYSYFELAKETVLSEVGKDPFLESFWLEKTFPNRVKVVILERRPAFMIESIDNKCALLDERAFTLRDGGTKEECDSIKAGYSIIEVDALPYPNFSVNTQSSFLYALSINEIKKVFDEYGLAIKSAVVKDGVCTLTLETDQKIVVSFNQSLNEQMARFVVVMEEVRNKNIVFSLLDLRYKRPVIRIK